MFLILFLKIFSALQTFRAQNINNFCLIYFFLRSLRKIFTSSLINIDFLLLRRIIFNNLLYWYINILYFWTSLNLMDRLFLNLISNFVFFGRFIKFWSKNSKLYIRFLNFDWMLRIILWKRFLLINFITLKCLIVLIHSKIFSFIYYAIFILICKSRAFCIY
jgi:hypothetical protein